MSWFKVYENEENKMTSIFQANELFSCVEHFTEFTKLSSKSSADSERHPFVDYRYNNYDEFM